MKSGASDPFADDAAEDEREQGDDAVSREIDTEQDERRRETTAEDVETAVSELSDVDGQSSESVDSATSQSQTRGDQSGDGALTGGSTADHVDGGDGTTEHTDADGNALKDSSGAETANPSDEEGFTRSELPYVLRRERVKDERPEVHQLFVQEETHDAAVEAERALEDRLDEDLSRTDAREAIYLAGMDHLDDAEAILREWGYDL